MHEHKLAAATDDTAWRRFLERTGIRSGRRSAKGTQAANPKRIRHRKRHKFAKVTEDEAARRLANWRKSPQAKAIKRREQRASKRPRLRSAERIRDDERMRRELRDIRRAIVQGRIEEYFCLVHDWSDERGECTCNETHTPGLAHKIHALGELALAEAELAEAEDLSWDHPAW